MSSEICRKISLPNYTWQFWVDGCLVTLWKWNPGLHFHNLGRRVSSENCHKISLRQGHQTREKWNCTWLRIRLRIWLRIWLFLQEKWNSESNHESKSGSHLEVKSGNYTPGITLHGCLVKFAAKFHFANYTFHLKSVISELCLWALHSGNYTTRVSSEIFSKITLR